MNATLRFVHTAAVMRASASNAISADARGKLEKILIFKPKKYAVKCGRANEPLGRSNAVPTVQNVLAHPTKTY